MWVQQNSSYITLFYGLRRIVTWKGTDQGIKIISYIPLGMVPASLPVDCYRAFSFVQHLSSSKCCSSHSRHTVKQVIKHRAIKAWGKEY